MPLRENFIERVFAYQRWTRMLVRDPIRSTLTHASKSLGIRWLCLAVLVPVPWS
jgi:hypothetical protein